jgi:hypothetical protein
MSYDQTREEEEEEKENASRFFFLPALMTDMNNKIKR